MLPQVSAGLIMDLFLQYCCSINSYFQFFPHAPYNLISFLRRQPFCWSLAFHLCKTVNRVGFVVCSFLSVNRKRQDFYFIKSWKLISTFGHKCYIHRMFSFTGFSFRQESTFLCVLCVKQDWKVTIVECLDIPDVSFTPHRTNMVLVYCFTWSHSCANAIRDRCWSLGHSCIDSIAVVTSAA